MRFTLKTKLHGHGAEDGWFYHLGNIYRRISCFLVASLIVDSVFVDERVRFIFDMTCLLARCISHSNRRRLPRGRTGGGGGGERLCRYVN